MPRNTSHIALTGKYVLKSALLIAALLPMGSANADAPGSVSGKPAGTARIEWIEKDFDFGMMREEAGPKTGKSRFINLGPDTISIFSVRPSCGCTSADFPDSPILPGDTATISYTYDPHLRPGKFDKSVRVRLSDGKRHTIRITGNVLGTPGSVATMFPFDAGPLKLSESVINAGEVTMGQAPLLFVNSYCMSLDSIQPIFKSSDKALVTGPKNCKVGPGEVSAFSLNLNTYALGAYGPIEIPVVLTPDPADPGQTYTLTFKAFVNPDPKLLAAGQKGKSPKAILPSGPISISRDTRSAEISIQNAGKGPLEVLSISSQSRAVSIPKLPKPIKPGKQAKAVINIDPANLPASPARITVDIVTNDPDNPHSKVSLAISSQ